jgi:NDMA-dependent alcohol dehydrogenase
VTVGLAAVVRGPGPMSIEEVEWSDPRAGEVRVRMAVAALCHSDLHTITYASAERPQIVGHEASGTVEAIGPGVTRVVPGDRVIFSFIPSCGVCAYCRRGAPVDCVRGLYSDGTLLDGTFRVRTAAGEELGQMARLGIFSEVAVVPEVSCLVVPPDTDMRAASLLSCGFTTGAGAAINAARTEIGETVAVVGVGGVGTSAIQGAVVAGAAEIIAIDIHDHKLESARVFGATQTINARESDWVEAVRDLTGGIGADKAIMCVSTVSGPQLTQLVAAIRKGGIAVIVGAASALQQIDINPGIELMRNRKTLTGTLFGSTNPQADQLMYLDLFRAGRLKLLEMITQSYRFDEINQGFDDLAAGKNVRGIVEF